MDEKRDENGEVDSWYDANQFLDGPGRALLHLSLDRSGDRICVRACWPRSGGINYFPYKQKTPEEITIAAKRGAGAVAKAIQDRLLPIYLEELCVQVRRIAEQEDHNARCVSLASKLFPLVGNNKPIREDHLETYFNSDTPSIYGTLKIDGPDSVHLKISGLPEDIAREVLNLLAVSMGGNE
jgi:hypothetical protein